MAVAIAKEHRELAKREGLFMFQVMIDGRHLTLGYGMSSTSGACTKEQADKLREWMREYNAASDADERPKDQK